MMCRRIKSIWSRLSNALRLRLGKQKGLSLDSLLRSLLLHHVLTPKHLGAIHGTSSKSVLGLLQDAAKLEEPLVRSLGSDVSGPLQQCYLLTDAGRHRGRMSLQIEQRPRGSEDQRLASPIYFGSRCRSVRTPDLIILPRRDGSDSDAPHVVFLDE